MAKAFKKGLFFSCYFLCIFLPVKSKSFWEEELYWVQAIGVWVVRKRWGILDLGLVGGQNIARTKCGMVVGLGLFFFSFFFLFFRFFSFSLLQSRLRWDYLGSVFIRTRQSYFRHSRIKLGYHGEARNKKNVGIKRTG
jgi:hypothetical protein